MSGFAIEFFFFFSILGEVGFKTGFLWSLSWYSLYRPDWPRSWRSTCLCLLIARIKGMHHSIQLTIECFKLKAGKRYLEHTVLEAFQVWDANKSCEVQKSCCI